MASNVLYPMAKQRMISGSNSTESSGEGQPFDLASAQVVHCSLVSSSYVYSQYHQYYGASLIAAGGNGINAGANNAALPWAHQVGATGTLASKTFVSGVFDAADITFSAVAATSSITHVIVFLSGAYGGKDDYLIAHFDTGSGGGINMTSNNGDITVKWNASGIFSI